MCDTVCRTTQQGDGADGASGGDGGGERKRKRPKTRSKQKNIRRDTRPAERRPEHVREGGEACRALTDETKKRMGVSA